MKCSKSVWLQLLRFEHYVLVQYSQSQVPVEPEKVSLGPLAGVKYDPIRAPGASPCLYLGE